MNATVVRTFCSKHGAKIEDKELLGTGCKEAETNEEMCFLVTEDESINYGGGLRGTSKETRY